MNPVSAFVSNDYITEEEYLANEKISEVRHEYIDGKVYAMADNNKRHNRIRGNISVVLILAIRCDLYSADVKLRIPSRKSYFYPDIILTCNDDLGNDYYVENPCLVFEVLSKSTVKKDYREKLLTYQTIPSLQHYIVVAQNEVHIDLFYREEQGWWFKTFSDLDDVIKLPCVDTELTVKEIYEGIEFDSIDKAE